MLRYAQPMSDTAASAALIHRLAAGGWLRRALERPRWIALALIAGLTATGWISLGLIMAGMGEAPAVPGIFGNADVFGRALMAALCGPAGGVAAGPQDFALIFAMWAAMVLAMMLPTAGGMIMTYADIAEAATAKREPVVSPLVLTAGYTIVWLGFAVIASLMHIAVARLAAGATTEAATAGGVLLAAGAYQFSALKHACLTRCQRPFPFFFANWTSRRAGIFRLGLRQGLSCLGCCWAMMLVMFAVGAMNLVWMALLGIVMGIEKLTTTRKFSHTVGAVFCLAGVALIAGAIAAIQ